MPPRDVAGSDCSLVSLRPLDPQDVGVGICAGQWWCQCRARNQSTCGSSAHVQGVWSPSGPQRLTPVCERSLCVPLFVAARPCKSTCVNTSRGFSDWLGSCQFRPHSCPHRTVFVLCLRPMPLVWALVVLGPTRQCCPVTARQRAWFGCASRRTGLDPHESPVSPAG
jgi:hypothetical protein